MSQPSTYKAPMARAAYRTKLKHGTKHLQNLDGKSSMQNKFKYDTNKHLQSPDGKSSVQNKLKHASRNICKAPMARAACKQTQTYDKQAPTNLDSKSSMLNKNCDKKSANSQRLEQHANKFKHISYKTALTCK